MLNKVAPQSGCHLFLICVQFLYLQVYTKMYSGVHKNVLRRTQKCTQAYIKMYSPLHFLFCVRDKNDVMFSR